MRSNSVRQLRAQVPGHHLDPGERIGALPGLGLDAGEQEFRRQRAGALRKEGVDSGGVGIELAARVRVQGLQRGLCHVAHAQGAQELVRVQGRGSERLGQPSGADAPVHFHLPQAILRMNETEREVRVRDAAGVDVGHAIAVAHDVHRRLETGQRDVSVELRQRLAQPDVSCSGGEHDDQGERQKCTAYCFHWGNSRSSGLIAANSLT